MINSYSDIKDRIEYLYNNSSFKDFVAICEAALGGKRGLNRSELVGAMTSGSIERIHNVLEPLVNNLIRENKESADKDENNYNIIPLGENEFRLLKLVNKDKYKRGAEDYIVNLDENSCTCPEFTNRLRNLSIPCKHQYMLTPTTASVTIDNRISKEGRIMLNKEAVKELVKVAEMLDKKGFYKEADLLDSLISGVIEQNPELEDEYKQAVEYIKEVNKQHSNLYPAVFLTKQGIDLNTEYYITEEAHSPEIKDRIAKWAEENIEDPNVYVGQFTGEYKCPSCIALKLNVTLRSLDDIKREMEKFLTYIPQIENASNQILKEEMPKLEEMSIEEIEKRNRPMEQFPYF